MSDFLGRRDVVGLLGMVSALPIALGEASATPVPPHAHGFDFLFGDWTVRHRKLRKRLADNHEWTEFPGTLSVRPILSGQGNFDVNELDDPAGAYEAHSLRLYNTNSDKWSIWWLDSRAPSVEPPVVGGFSGRKGSFYVPETFNGRPIIVRTTYEPLSVTTAQWTQAFSPDGGTTWEINWYMDFSRAGK